MSTLDQSLARARAQAPEHVAVQSGTQTSTYRELDDASRSLAAGLRRSGIKPSDRVAIALPNGIDAAVAIYGTLRARAAMVPLNPSIKGEKLATILADCGASMLLCSPELGDAIPAARAAVPGLRIAMIGDDSLLASDPDIETPGLEVDLAAIIYTSGSSGRPKGVALTHRNMVFAATTIATYLGMSSSDRVLSVLPMSFDYGLYQLLLCVEMGATLILERSGGYPGAIVAQMIEQRVTGLPGVPTLFRLLLSLPGFREREWPNLRFITNTGAALSRDTIRDLRAIAPSASLFSMYGLTECKRVSFLPPEEIDRRPDSVGRALPGTEAWIEDDAGRRVGPGEIGQLMVRGPHVMQGYWNDPENTAKRLRGGPLPWQRILATGDRFRCDEDGFLYFVGRSDDMIKTRGELVSPREVENVLLEVPGVLDAVVVGVPDELLGQAVVAHVSPRADVSVDQRKVLRHCRERLESHLVPQRVVVHPSLPKSPNGKIDRRALSQGAPNPETEDPPTAPDHDRGLALLLSESRRLVGCRVTDSPIGVSIADWTNICRVVEATGDENPLFLDVEHGARSAWRTLVAPPAFVLAIQSPHSSGALESRALEAVDLLVRLDLLWDDHIKLGDRVDSDVRLSSVDAGPRWRDRNTLDITSRATYRSEGRLVAEGTATVRIYPLQAPRESFIEREMARYSPDEIAKIEAGLEAEPRARGARPRYWSEVAVGDSLPNLVRGPFTWSEMITWIIAEGHPHPAGNLRRIELESRPGRIRPHGATNWPISDHQYAREDLLAYTSTGFPAPCVRGTLIVALAIQLITTWMGDDAFLRQLSTSLELPVLYGDTLWLGGRVSDKFESHAIAVELWGINQLGQRAFSATGVVHLPEPGRPIRLPRNSHG